MRPICLHMAFGSFPATMPETMAHKAQNIYFLTFTESLLVPALINPCIAEETGFRSLGNLFRFTLLGGRGLRFELVPF